MKKKSHLEIALTEIGPIEPWWSEENGMFIFEHSAYPRVVGGDTDKEGAIQSYLRALSAFIVDRLTGEISEEAERATSGRGGKREGAGRKGIHNSVRVRVAPDISDWVKDPKNTDKIRHLMLEESKQKT